MSLAINGESITVPAVTTTTVTVDHMTKSQLTPGQKLWQSLCRADDYAQQAASIHPPVAAGKMDPERSTRAWFQGMSRHIKESFPEKFRQARERAGLTQQQLSELADLSVTGLAMIERGERTPTLDTAARICWALDVASGNV
jgi:DNA-binding XRE family transcriptional regulator